MDRRTFLTDTSKVLAGAGFAGLTGHGPQRSKKKVAANDKITIALVGCRGVGWANLLSHLKQRGVECLGLCDVDQNILEERAEELQKLTDGKFDTYGDFRKLLERKDLDAVIVATPDHWHALPMIYACQAGKDVYVEKPLARTVEECEAMVTVAQNTGRIVQVGLQQRSAPHWQQAIDFVHTGKLGSVRQVRAWAYVDWKEKLPPVPAEPVPEGVDYQMWLGPAPERSFNKNRFHFTWRWYWDYGGGLMTDWGVHMLDIVLLAMQVEAPKAVTAGGGKYAYPDDARETPDSLQATYEYENFLLSWEHTIGLGRGPFDRNQGVAFYGDNGTLVATRDGWEVISQYDREAKIYRSYKMQPLPLQPKQGDSRDLHARNFIESIRSRKPPVADIMGGSRTTINANIGNIAWRTGSKIRWDAAKNRCIDNREANKLLQADYHGPWKLPKA